jgi:hypothetical protein
MESRDRRGDVLVNFYAYKSLRSALWYTSPMDYEKGWYEDSEKDTL